MTIINNRPARTLFLALTLCLAAVVILTTDTLSGTIGTFTDPRDGKTYRTVKIGKQTWMAENLNYKPKTGKSRCYKDSDSYCKKYGRLYNWKTAKTVCPSGWHLPSRREWDSLTDYAGDEKIVSWIDGSDSMYDWLNAGKRLMSMYGWYSWDDVDTGNRTDEFGFSALPGGYYDYDVNDFSGAGHRGHWWTATENGIDKAFNRDMYYNGVSASEYAYSKRHYYSVRCLAG
jgi:uncharacterized protein (TIGR02145 family)